MVKDAEQINIEIHMEVVGDDDTPKVKYTNHWSTVAVLSLFAMVVLLLVGDMYSPFYFIAFSICFAVFFYSFALSSDKISDRATHPWKYKD